MKNSNNPSQSQQSKQPQQPTTTTAIHQSTNLLCSAASFIRLVGRPAKGAAYQ
jgi:hypothetical protein